MKHIKKYLVIISIFLLVIFLIFLIYIILNQRSSLTGNVILEKYVYTKAICNESNFCEDYEIECNGNKIISQTKIKGAFVQHSLNWKDPREKTDLCG